MVYMIHQLKKLFMSHMLKNWFIFSRWQEQLNKKMVSVQEKAQCVEWFIQTRSDIQVRRNFRTRYGRPPPSSPSIRKWYDNFMQTGGVDVKHHTGRPRTSEEDTEQIWLSFQCSPQKSNWTALRELQIARLTVHKVLQKCLSLHPYQLQLDHWNWMIDQCVCNLLWMFLHDWVRITIFWTKWHFQMNQLSMCAVRSTHII